MTYNPISGPIGRLFPHPAKSLAKNRRGTDDAEQGRAESESVGRSRLLMFEQLGSSISWPFLTVLVFWICVLFLGFGLFARFNMTVTVALSGGRALSRGCDFPYPRVERPLPRPHAYLRRALAQRDSPARSIARIVTPCTALCMNVRKIANNRGGP